MESKAVDQTVRRRFPYPVAAAWHRVTLATTDENRIRCLIATNEILLRTLVAFLLPDYLRGPAAPAVEKAIQKLDRPTDGQWLELLRGILRQLRKRSGPESFFPEAQPWFFSANGSSGEGDDQLARVVFLRNKIVHSVAPGPAKIREHAKDLHQALVSAFSGLRWLSAYRAFRVRSQEPNRRRTASGRMSDFFSGKLQFFVGTEEHSNLQGAEWDAFLSPDAAYLVNPNASGLLDLRPFLEVLTHPTTAQEHVYLFRAAPELKKVVRAHDESGIEIAKAVSSEEEGISFERWLGQRESVEFFRPLTIAGGAFRQLPPSPAGEGAEEWGPRYQRLEELGRGGMATVYRVRDLDLGEEVALKVLNKELAEDEVYCERFRREARRMLKVHHPRVVPATDIGTLPSGQPFLKMQVFGKGSLQDQIRPQGLPETHVRRWAEDALEALICIHQAGLVHRDIKPSNFLLNEDGHACLTDFGIALNAEDVRLTSTLEQVGTLAYMAPEQRTQRNVTDKADLYSLAVVLHELWTGTLPNAPGANIDGPFGEFLRWIGDPEPGDRPKAAEALKRMKTWKTTRSRAADAADTVKEKSVARRVSGLSEAASDAVDIPKISADFHLIDGSEAEGSSDALPSSPTVPAIGPNRLSAPDPAAKASKINPAPMQLRRLAVLMLAVLFILNFVETKAESLLRSNFQLGVDVEQSLGEAAFWLEQGFTFEPHDQVNRVALWGCTTTYFVFFPLLAAVTATYLYRYRSPRLMFLLATATAVDYLVFTLPFYIFFPVPERWAFQPSGAILLSDLVTSKLIELFRPFSGLNNCFPSFHVSMTVVLLACLYQSRAWFWRAAVAVGLAIALSTFVLGIHWISDIAAGMACGLVSYRLAVRCLPRIEATLAPAIR